MNGNLCKIDLCCGDNKPDGFIGVDSYPGEKVDIVADLNIKFPFDDNTADFIRAYNSIEHLKDKIFTMNEIWRIGKPNSIVDIYVPSTDGRGAFQDPTHISYWNINSFAYYSNNFPFYLKLCKKYGFKGEFNIASIKNETLDSEKIVFVKVLLTVIK